jgi:hypothetical protein
VHLYLLVVLGQVLKVNSGASALEFGTVDNADTATALATARTIGGTLFDGSANIDVALATLATTVTITDNESTDENNAIIFTAGGEIDGGNLGLESDGTLTYNPSTGKVTATGFVGTLTGNVTGNTSGTAATVTGAAQTNITSVGTLTALQVDNINIDGNAITSTAGVDLTITPLAGQQIVLDGTIVIDAGVVTGATSITSTAFVGNITGDVTGNADTATTLATARTIGGVSFDGSANINLPGVNSAGNQNTSGSAATLTTARTIGGTSFDGSANIDVALATLATTATVSDSTANTNFPVVFHNESNALLDDTGALRYNPSTGTLLVPNLVVAGTTTTVDTVTMEAANAIIFEGATADIHETTLTITDPTADRTITLPDATGTVALTSSNITGSAATLTTARTIGGVSFDGSANINLPGVNSAGNQNTSGSAATVTGAAQTNITSLGTLTTLTVDNIIVDGTNIGHTSDTDSIAIAANGVVTFSQIPVLPANSIDSDYYVDGSIDTAHIADNQITLAKMAGIARGKIIYGDASGNPAVLTAGSNTQVLTSDGTDISWEDAAGSSTDNAVARFDSTTGKLLQNSTVTISDAGAIAAASLTLTTDLAVADGGTGAGTFADNGVLFGNGTSAIGATAVGTSAQVLTSNGPGVAPTFQDAAGGAWTLIGTQVGATSASLVQTGLSNTYDSYIVKVSYLTSATANGRLQIQVGDSDGVDSGANDYAYYNAAGTEAGTAWTGTNDNLHSAVIANGAAGAASTDGLSATIYIDRFASTNQRTLIWGNWCATEDNGTIAGGVFFGFRQAAINLDRIALSYSTGNIGLGRMSVFGLKHT